jgi:hypothetical protein
MRLAATTMFVAACASTVPAHKRPAPAIRVPLRPAYIPFVDDAQLVARPSIDVSTVTPDTDRGRPWPLTELPSLQPHHDFAMARDLCTGEWAERNKQHAELLAYGAAWCRIQTGDNDGIAALARLAETARGDIKRAARLDVINLVARRDAATALSQLRDLRLDAPADLDLLAATYGALQLREDAAIVVDRCWRVDRKLEPVARCERTLAWAALDDNTALQLEYAANGGRTCSKRVAAVACAVEAAHNPLARLPLAAVRECFNEFPDDADTDRRAWLLVAYFRWKHVRKPADWLALSRDAENALGLDGAEDLAIAALDNAVLASSCEPGLLRDVAAAAYRIANRDQHASQYEARLDALRAITEKRCTELHE